MNERELGWLSDRKMGWMKVNRTVQVKKKCKKKNKEKKMTEKENREKKERKVIEINLKGNRN